MDSGYAETDTCLFMMEEGKEPQPYFCKFRMLGGGTLIVPYRRITKITVDEETSRSKIYLADEKIPIVVVNRPEEMISLTNQIDY